VLCPVSLAIRAREAHGPVIETAIGVGDTLVILPAMAGA
jgi:hypothetical protein